MMIQKKPLSFSSVVAVAGIGAAGLACAGGVRVQQHPPKAIPTAYTVESPGFAKLIEKQKMLTGKLTGESEIRAGLTLTDRYTPANREASRAYLIEALSEYGLKGLRHRYSGSGENIYAELRATTPTKEYIVIGAHFDSVRDCPGANDNATGVVMALSLAEYVATLEKRTKNIYFVFFDEEERGLAGSRHFAQKLIDDSVTVAVVMTIDQVGWDNDKDGAIELEVPFEGVLERFQKTAVDFGFGVEVLTSNVTSTDHRSFRKLGMKAVGITEEYRHRDTTPHYHKSTDTFETVNFPYLAKSTLLVLRAVQSLM
jgi:Zn-dependent M28 family amino/carboxypeptidase